MKLTFQPVTTAQAIRRTSFFARRIWRGYYPALVGRPLVEYILKRSQSSRAIATQIRHGASYYVIKSPAGRWVGYLAVEPRPDELFLSKFYVAAGKRGRGLGRQAMEFVAALARRKKLSRVSLTVNRKNLGAVCFYRSTGFTIKKRINKSIGENFFMRDYWMVKQVVGRPGRVNAVPRVRPR